jgi:hypothetical protein
MDVSWRKEIAEAPRKIRHLPGLDGHEATRYSRVEEERVR